MAFIASSFRVTEEDWLSETDLSGPHSFFWMFLLLLKELIIIFLFINSVSVWIFGIYFHKNVYWEVLNVSYGFFPNRWTWSIAKATKRVISRKKMFVDEADTFKTCSWKYLLHKLCFCFGQVRTLVAVAYISLLWLYLANSQVSVYRIFGSLILMKATIINEPYHKKICLRGIRSGHTQTVQWSHVGDGKRLGIPDIESREIVLSM